MMNSTCNKFIYALLLTFTISCGVNKRPTEPTTFTPTETISAIQSIDVEERNIATRICYAYESKYTKYLSIDKEATNFNFKISNNDCRNTALYNISSKLLSSSDQGLIYNTSDSRKFYKYVQFHNRGYLSRVCTSIKNNLDIINTVDEAGFRVQIQFFKDELDSFTLKYFKKDNTGLWKIQSAETFKVRTQFNYSSSKNQILGMDEVYVEEGICSDVKTYSFRQSFEAI